MPTDVQLFRLFLAVFTIAVVLLTVADLVWR